MTPGFCPQCKKVPVVRLKQFGTFPRCPDCLEKNRRGRCDRANQRRREGKSKGHYNAQGERYADKADQVQVTCRFCITDFQRSSRLRGRAVCEECKPRAEQEKRNKALKKIKEAYWKDPVLAREKRLIRTLNKMQVPLEWYNARRGRCGICGTTDPGGKGYWHLDHDHNCCPPGKGCSTCVRGLLCHHCNIGLGCFKDDVLRLRAAIRWVTQREGGAFPLQAI